MSILIGSDDTTGWVDNTAANGMAGVRLIANAFVCATSGTLTTLALYTQDSTGDAQDLKLCIYSDAGVLLGVTSAVATHAGAAFSVGTLTAAVPVVAGQTYYLGWYADAGYTGYRSTTADGDAKINDTGSFTSPAASVSFSTDSGIEEFLMYGDGTAGGGTTGNASGAGVTDAANAPTAGVNVGTPEGDGIEVEASAPAGSALAAIFGDGTGVETEASAPAAHADEYVSVTLAEPFYTGPGSILWAPGFTGTPVAGDVVRYPTTNGFTVLANGEVTASVNTGTYRCYYDDGTGEVAFDVTLTADIQAWGAGVTDAATAPSSSQYGGVNISGAGKTDAATAPQGSAVVGTIASGAGKTDTATAPQAGATGAATVSGSGVTDAATAPDGVGEIVAQAQGAGVTDAATAPDGSAAGNIHADGAGVVASAAAPEGRAVGDRLPGSIPYAALTVVYPKDLLIARAAA